MPTPQEILATPMEQNDAEAATIREYLVGLALGVWHEREGFSGKRPFGNSSWDYEMYAALVTAAHMEATLDSDGYIEDFSDEERSKADALIDGAIRHLGDEDQSGIYNRGRDDFAEAMRRDLSALRAEALSAERKDAYDKALALVAALLGES